MEQIVPAQSSILDDKTAVLTVYDWKLERTPAEQLRLGRERRPT